MNTVKYKVAETFVSINGESRFAGELAHFIRFTGCNLRCSYCDTAWALDMSAPCVEMSEEEIISAVEREGIKRITLTGGEPLLQKGIGDLIEALLDKDFYVEIETNGAVDIGFLRRLPIVLKKQEMLSVTLDYKCPSSGMEDKMLMDNYRYLTAYDNVKFVVGDRNDLDKARFIIESEKLLQSGVKIYLSPVFGEIESSEIVEYMKEYKMNGVRHQLQQHKFIWPPDARGV